MNQDSFPIKAGFWNSTYLGGTRVWVRLGCVKYSTKKGFKHSKYNWPNLFNLYYHNSLNYGWDWINNQAWYNDWGVADTNRKRPDLKYRPSQKTGKNCHWNLMEWHDNLILCFNEGQPCAALTVGIREQVQSSPGWGRCGRTTDHSESRPLNLGWLKTNLAFICAMTI